MKKKKALPIATSSHSPVAKEYNELRDAVRGKIQSVRYLAARAVNRELLQLYFSVGGLLSANVQQKGWGAKVIVSLSNDIQADFPGIRGFSERNLKNMRRFYEYFLPTPFRQLLTAQITDSADPSSLEFLSVSFTAHILLLQKCRNSQEWTFYLKSAAMHQWSVELLATNIESNLYAHQGKMQNNFRQSLPGALRKDAIRAFRDEYLFPFLQVEDPNDEYLVENAIVANVKKFLLSLGREFAFMGNQYRIVIDETEYFVDLLFYHRGLQSMVAVELKTGKFKPEYAGKMNFYLAALDEKVKKKNENPSIGIILCREKKKTTVEFAFKFSTAPIGVATYKLSETLPKAMAKYLPNSKELILAIEEVDGVKLKRDDKRDINKMSGVDIRDEDSRV